MARADPRPGDDAHNQPHEDPQDEHLNIWSTASLLPPLLPLQDLIDKTPNNTNLNGTD